jgi:MoxR-like ATPase
MNKRKGWKIAPETTKTYGQKVTNRLLREEFGEEVTNAQLTEFQTKYGWYPFYIRKDRSYRIAEALYRVPQEHEPLSPKGPQGRPAKVWSKTSPDAGSVVVPDVPNVLDEPAVATPELMEDVVSQPQPVLTGTFRNDADYSAGDMQRRLEKIENEASSLARVPKRLKEFVPYGDYELVQNVINSVDLNPPAGQLSPYPTVFITGLSGCGKTLNVKQACAEAGREYVRVNITSETDEDDLLGGFRLRKGETYFDMGPVTLAAIRGAVLLIDEIDQANAKIMCLQALLEGEPITLKKIGMTIVPKAGFCVFATANTKGQGDETGKFVTAMLLNEAFLDRFWFTIEQNYPPIDVEAEILIKTFTSAGGTLTSSSRGFFETLARWAENIRKAYAESAADSVIATRRLCHIVRVYKMLGTKDKSNQARAIKLCLSRFDSKTQATFADLWNKHVNIDGTPTNVGTLPKSPSKF